MKIRLIVVLIVCGLLYAGCASVKPSPIYTSAKGSGLKKPSDSEAPTRNPALATATVKSLKFSRMKQVIEKYRGVPYKWGGESMKGLDCSGFTRLVFSESVGFDMPHKAALQFNLGKRIPVRSMKFGDLVFFKDIESKGISHVGIYVGGGKFAHASLSSGVINSGLDEAYYKKRFIGARRVID